MDSAADKAAEGAQNGHGVGPLAAETVEAEPQVSPSPEASTARTQDSPKSLTTLEDDDDKVREDGEHGERYAPIHATPSNASYAPHGVSVERAEADFAELSKELSAISQEQPHLPHAASRTRSHGQMKGQDPEKDLERADTHETRAPFDLEETLRGAKEHDETSGIKSKRIGVIWDQLTVKGIGGVKHIVPTFPDAFLDFVNVPGTLLRLFGLGKKGSEVAILQGFRGVVRPGEMVLVLGRPGSGCTSFLKVIANQRHGYTAVGGEVRYGPYDAATFARKFRGEAVYNQEDDVHNAPLTVRQTLAFALDTKTPGKRPTGMSKKVFKERVVALLLKMFNIEHTADTVVGNQFIRGISGGERKRVSVAEMLITGATILSWDNSTRGLDASTALDYAKSLRIMTNIYQTTTFVSLYQASENIYRQFDKVMVIDGGRMAYFGPAAAARGYFEGIGFAPKPRQTTPDYLTGCTDPFEREYAAGRSAAAGDVPSSPDALAAAFDASRPAAALAAEMQAYRQRLAHERPAHADFEAAHHEAKRRGAPAASVYVAPLHLQIAALMRRQFLVKWQDRFGQAVGWATTLTIAVVLGTVWLRLPPTSAGAFTRGGLLFISLLFNALQAFGELGTVLLGRGIVNKHRAFAFHRPSALWLAQIFVDGAFAAAKILVFSIIVYFMCGLARDAGAFFTFFLIIFTGYMAMTLFFRSIACLCPDFDYALKFAVVVITLLVLTSGYLIQHQSEQAWLSWIFYVNVLGLGFSSLMINEFSRITLRCTSESLVPSGPGYTDIAHQACTLQGGTAGSDVVPGHAYISTGFQYLRQDLWRNYGLIVVLIVVFLVTNVTLGEALAQNYGAAGRTVTFFAKETGETRELNRKLRERKKRRQERNGVDESSELHVASKAVLTFENLTYDVPTRSGQLRLLRDVFGYVRPGELTALMGASGAGKTTLLDVLAARKNVGVVGGAILVDGQPPGTAFQRGTSYAEQLDVHEATSSVREALRFSADLRQPYATPRADKYAYVEEVIALLEMEDIADAVIGSGPEAGLAVEQRKRVTIGVELAAKPELLLFLDEPTSGLDGQSAFNVVRFLRKLARAGQSILCTIHQPNASLFENFDRLLLLQKGGETIYFGDVGPDASTLLDYFSRHGAHCPPDANPAEWMLDAIGAGQAPRIGDRDWGSIWRASPELDATKREIVEIKRARLESVSEGGGGGGRSKGETSGAPPEREYATPLAHQIRVVARRTQRAFWRSPNYGFTRLFNHVVLAVVAGFAYFQLDASCASLQYRVFVIFQVTVLPALILAQVEPKYDLSRLVFYREAAAKAYGQFAFALAMVLGEMPYSLLCAVGFFLPIYYLPGFQREASRAGYQFLVVLVTEMFSVTLGQMIAALTPSSFISVLVNPFVIITFALFCGVTIPEPQIPAFWRAWLYQLDPFTRLVGGMTVTALHDLPVVCAPHELQRFASPPDLSCADYMRPFFAAGGAGYLTNASMGGAECEYCAYRVGDEFYTPLGFAFEHRWRDLGIFAAFVGSNLVVLFLASRYLNFNRR